MNLSKYHQGYVVLPEEKIKSGLDAKAYQLSQIFSHFGLVVNKPFVRVAVLGCADKRFIKGHKEIFTKLFNKPVEVTTFDITIEHLKEEEGVVEHDCTKPLPGEPYDFIFSHIILKFMPGNQQWLILKNSFDALAPNGFAAHIMNVEGKTVATNMLAEGYYQVLLDEHKKSLQKFGIKFENIIVKANLEDARELECMVIFK